MKRESPFFRKGSVNSSEQSEQQTNTSRWAPANEPKARGWTRYSERINGRLAMIGFASLLAVELLSG